MTKLESADVHKMTRAQQVLIGRFSAETRGTRVLQTDVGEFLPDRHAAVTQQVQK